MSNKSATARLYPFLARLERLAPGATDLEAYALLRCEMTLSRWAERECGDGSNRWIERDKATGAPYCYYTLRSLSAETRRYRIADRETGALKRAARIAAQFGLAVYHQGDPRGVTLYIGRPEDMTSEGYTNGLACY